MQKEDKDRILKKIDEGIFDAKLLVNCIAKLNGKIERKYRYVLISSANRNIEAERIAYEENLNQYKTWIAYRKPILDILMKKYRLSLEDVKRLAKNAKYEELPTYKMIDAIRERILSGVFLCV